MPLSPQQVATYHRDGVLPLGRVIEPVLVEEARTHLEALRAKNLMDNPSAGTARRTFRMLDTRKRDPWFQTIFTHPAVLDAAEAVLGPDIQLFQDNIFYKPARDGDATAWHQDNIWWQANPPNMLTIWIALDDVDASNGAVQYIPGSQTNLIEPETPVQDVNGLQYKALSPAQIKQIEQQQSVTFVVPAGHAVMHHCQTLHGAPPNNSDRLRRGYTVHLAQTGVVKLDPSTNPVLRGRPA
ncbi:MAG: Ectoine dioxygenase [Verrucomicrobiae bacterium]|nr:Ectoine dioxygenase [Verrucomicrobiae bacterium]